MMTSYKHQAYLDHHNTQESGQRDRSALIRTNEILFMSISSHYEHEHKFFYEQIVFTKSVCKCVHRCASVSYFLVPFLGLAGI